MFGELTPRVSTDGSSSSTCSVCPVNSGAVPANTNPDCLRTVLRAPSQPTSHRPRISPRPVCTSICDSRACTACTVQPARSAHPVTLRARPAPPPATAAPPPSGWVPGSAGDHASARCPRHPGRKECRRSGLPAAAVAPANGRCRAAVRPCPASAPGGPRPRPAGRADPALPAWARSSRAGQRAGASAESGDSACSSSRTEQPAWASSQDRNRPTGPAPAMTTSYNMGIPCERRTGTLASPMLHSVYVYTSQPP